MELSLWSDLKRILLYPFSPKGGVVFVVMLAAGLVPVLSVLIWLPAAAYGMLLLRDSARGGHSLPALPAREEAMDTMLWPTLRLFGVTMIAIAPSLIAFVGFGLRISHPLTVTLFLCGTFVAPLWTALIVAHERFWRAVHPMQTIRILRRIGREYLTIWAFILGTLAVRATFEKFLPYAPWWRLLPQAFTVWAFLVEFHLLGLLIARTRTRVDWGI